MSSTQVNSLVVAFEVTKATSYTYVTAIAILVYDAFLLFGQEVEHIYSGPFTNIKILYVLIRHLATVDSLFYLYISQTTAIPPSVCKAVTWITGFARHVAYTCVIKSLLVLRLRALYGKNNRKVTILLGIVMTIEVITALFIFLLVSISTQVYGILVVPFPGCIVASPLKVHNINQYGTIALWASKVFSNSVEVTLTLLQLYRSLSQSDHNLLTSFERMRHWQPVFYIFYRDGTLFFIPLFIISLIGLLDSLRIVQAPTSWTLWLSLIYCTGGARLILNLRATNSEPSGSSGEDRVSSINQLSTINHLYTLQSFPQTYMESKEIPLTRLY